MFVMLMNERAMSPASDLSSEEETPLLLSEHAHDDHDVVAQDENGVVELKKSLLWRLYISHFLSTWNMRSYEFTVILLFAKAYPDTLLPTSIRGVLTNGATLLLSPAIGRWVDRHSRRFHTMRITILVQRLSIVLGCVLWLFLFSHLDTPHPHGRRQVVSAAEVLAPRFKDVIVAALMVFGIVERMCAVGNNLVMERDWVPTIASEVSSPPLHQLNAIMRRIDLISKILAPVFVSVLAIRLQDHPGYLALVTAVMNLGTVWVELISARSAWDRCNVLKRAREAKTTALEEEEPYLLPLPLRDDGMDDERELVDHDHPLPTTTTTTTRSGGLWLYLSSDVCLASISSALQSFSVLSLSGPMTTYLLTTRRYSLPLITAARTAISVIEIASTLLFPLAAGSTARAEADDPMAVLGLAGVTFQLALLTPCFIALLSVPVPVPTDSPASASPLYTTPLIFVFLGLSRLGHWTHNMAVQQIVQTRVPAARRVEFSGVEMTVVSAAEIGRWATAAIWPRPEQFAGVAAGGLVSVLVIWGLFTTWVVLSRRRHRQQEKKKKREKRRRGRE